MIIAVHTTTTNEHDSKEFKPLLNKTRKQYKQKGVCADKGYKVPDNDIYLKKENIKNHIMHRAYRNQPLTYWQNKFNRLISETRWFVERTFGCIRKWFGGNVARYHGLAKIHTQHVLLAIAHNLKRSPGIIVTNAQ